MIKKLKPFVSSSSLSKEGKFDILSVRCPEVETEKTKRLIAAAPEMYELLSFYVHQFEYGEDPEIYKEANELLARIDGKEIKHDTEN